MATPKPRSFQEILNRIKRVFIQKSGITDMETGSAASSFLEAAALSDFRSQSDIIAALNVQDIDRAEGSDLDNIGLREGLARPQAQNSSGKVNIFSKNFTKISTKIYAGTAAPPLGSPSVNVSDASKMPATGSIYIGRGSSNLEGPIAYTSITQVGNYYQINLSTNTTKNHNLNESVVLAQGGNRTIQAGTTVQTPQNTTAPSVIFRVINTVTIPDGEDIITDVPVVCVDVGSKGNVPAGGISEFTSSPFQSAGVTNTNDFVTGSDQTSDPDYRLLIKNFNQNKTKGTDLAIISASVGVASTDDNKKVTSAQVRSPSQRGEPGTLFVDDGSGYQSIFSGQGFEQVVDNANGGELYLQLQNEDLTKGLVITSFTAPFVLTGGMTLSVKVGGVLSEHTFASSDFATQNAADTFEVINSINNNNSLLFSARAVNNSKQISLSAKNFTSDDIEVTAPISGIDANTFLGLPTNLTYTLRLYKSDKLLRKDGIIPSIYTLPKSSWLSMSGSQNLTIKVDQSISITYTFQDSDFIPFGYPTLSDLNSITSWANVINSKIAGVTAVVEGNRIKLISNRGASSNSALLISPSTSPDLLSNLFGSSVSLSSQGAASDYALNRSTGQVQLSTPLVAGESITGGSKNTKAFIDSASTSTGTVTLGGSLSLPPRLWVILDAPASQVLTPQLAGSTLTITNPSTNRWRFTSNLSSPFSLVSVDNWIVLVDSAIEAIDTDLIGHWRVSAVDPSGTWVEVYMNDSLGTTGVATLSANYGVLFARSAGNVQKITLTSGLNTLTQAANSINSSLVGGTASIINGKKLRIASNSYSLSGYAYIAAYNTAALNLGFNIGDSSQSTVTHTAFSESKNSDLTMPTFLHDVIAIGDITIPPTSFVSTLNLGNNNINPNALVSLLNPYGKDSSNHDLFSQISNLSGTTVNIRPNSRSKDILAGDRYFTAEPFNFSSADTLVAILDKDTVNKSLNIPLSRKGTVSNAIAPTSTQFTAYDTDSGPTASYPTSFGDNFDFKDFKVHFRARQILDPSGINNKMLIRSAFFGPTGNNQRFSIEYPTLPATGLQSLVNINKNIDSKVFLASGNQRVGGGWNNTTQFDVTNPSGNTFRYTWNTNGAAPLFVSGAGVQVNDIVNISNNSTFNANNKTIFKVIAVTDIYFEVTSYSGVVESTIQLTNSTDLTFYPLNAAANTATLIGAFINSNLSIYLQSTQLESGAGVISTSTFDDNAGSSRYIQLADGENWLYVSNIGTTISPVNQFTLKVPRSVLTPTLVGEVFYLIPTRSEQIKRFLSVFAVTGLTSLGNISVSSEGNKVQIYSNLFGSNGAVQISGGTANSSEGAVVVSGSIVSDAVIISASRASNVVTLTTQNPHDLQAGDEIIVTDVLDSSFNGRFTLTSVTLKTLVYSQTAANATSSGGFVDLPYTKLSISNANKAGLQSGQWAKLSNNTSQAKNISFDSSTTVQLQAGVPAGFGTLTRSVSGTFQTLRSHSGTNTTKIKFEKQGSFVCVSWTGVGTNPDFLTGGVSEGDWVRITVATPSGTSINALNQGIFKIVKVFGSSSFYIENSTVLEEEAVLSNATDLRFYSYDSIMPGDKLIISGNFFGISNQGTYTVQGGSNFPSNTTLVLSPSFNANFAATPLSTNVNDIAIQEASPFYSYKKIKHVAQDPLSSNIADIVFEDDSLANKISVSSGGSVSVLNKLNFSTNVQVGEDSYKYYKGLISAVGKVIRGQASDPVRYPGVAASGSYIEISSPLSKRIQISIVIRSQTGIPFNSVKSRVQAAVAGYINKIGVGSPVVFSEIISAVQQIDGIQAIAISSPTYGVGNDQIVQNADQKPVCDSIKDVTVSLAT